MVNYLKYEEGCPRSEAQRAAWREPLEGDIHIAEALKLAQSRRWHLGLPVFLHNSVGTRSGLLARSIMHRSNPNGPPLVHNNRRSSGSCAIFAGPT